MRKAVTVIGMALASVPAALLVFVGLVALDVTRVIRQRANRGVIERAKPSWKQREDFYGRLAEAEFRVVNVGQTVIAK